MMAKLILSMDGLVLKEIPLTKERTTIGRKPHNDIQIDNLAISGDHAVIVTILNDSFLEDQNSTNGTYVNGQQIKKHFLQNNDVIELGKYRLKYVGDVQHAPDSTDFERTIVVRPDARKAFLDSAAGGGQRAPASAGEMVGLHSPGSVGTPAAPAATAPRTAVIHVLTGASAGKELELVKTLTTLGKPGVQVAVITRRPQGFFLTHVEGARFPIVNGVTLDSQPRELREHDVIEIAGVKMEFYFRA